MAEPSEQQSRRGASSRVLLPGDAESPTAVTAEGATTGAAVGHSGNPSDRDRADMVLARSREVPLFYRPDGTIDWIGGGCHRLLGVDPAELLGTSGMQLVHPADLPAVRRAARRLRRVGDTVAVEFRIRRPDGSEAWLEGTGDHLVDGSGHDAILVSVRDVTDRRLAEESTRFQADLLAAVGQSVVATDLHGRITYMNPAAEELYGWPAAEVLGRDGGAISVSEREGDGAELLARQIASGRPWAGRLWLRRRDGSEFLGQVTNTPLRDPEGRVVGLIGVTSDLTGQLALERAAVADRDRLAEAQRSAHLGSFEYDLRDGSVRFSDELYRILGLPVGSPVELGSYRSLVHPDDAGIVAAAVEDVVAGDHAMEVEHRIVRRDGQVRWVHVRNSSSAEDPSVLRGTVLDVTERRAAEERLAHQVRHDPLTGLANRLGITRMIEEGLASQVDGGTPVTIAFLDLDRFKVINDGLGHATGDEVLLEVSRRLRTSVGDLGTVGRFSGDEFVVLLRGELSPVAATELVETITSCLDDPVEVAQRRFFLSASVGVTTSAEGDTAESLLQSADMAMYESKRSPRRRVSFFDAPLARRARRNVAIETDLRHAVENDELVVEYQPVVRVADGACMGVESLLRWNHPRLGRISPGDFIGVAEETGMIVPIGEWVLARSLDQLARWQRVAGLEDLWVAVNVSASQLTRIDLDRTVARELERTGIRPHHLHPEITESVLMDRIDGSLDTLEALRGLGVHLSVDDFGTGYSSLSYLKVLPVQTLKIDRSFVDGLGTDGHDSSIVAAIVAMADALGLELLAEGVETTLQRRELQRLGCHLAQGYLWAAALSLDLVDAYLRSGPPGGTSGQGT